MSINLLLPSEHPPPTKTTTTSYTSTRNLTLAFFSPAATNEDWVNRLVARASQHPYCHVELYFETTNQCFSIMLGQTADLRTKTLASPCYEIVTLAVTQKEYDACLDFCRKAAKAEIVFDNHGMWCSWFARQCRKVCCCCASCCCCVCCCVSGKSSLELKKTFCSKIICEALQSACVEEVDDCVPTATTPSSLYHSMYKSKRRVCASVPYKREQMVKQKMINFQNRVYMQCATAVYSPG